MIYRYCSKGSLYVENAPNRNMAILIYFILLNICYLHIFIFGLNIDSKYCDKGLYKNHVSARRFKVQFH